MRWTTLTASGFTVLVLATTAAGCSKNSTPPLGAGSPQAVAPAAARPPITQIAPDLPLLPAGIANAARPVAVTKAAYEFAARHPEVMNFIPCFCGCERAGHKGNHDCFVAGRNDAGVVTDWDVHGMGCEICIDVGYEASRRYALGQSVVEIRTAIDEMYADYPNRTPTPKPSGGGRHDRP